ncbi:FAD-binding oxidoreductase [Niveibacterium umoris]|uniref:ferredoxin--NADP(+) reductase n=1 Tax=Niveibacterium umoris TaxID=1193620 RepID=A0A840BHQ7_9RHOO|nr:ferredoxin--NADP reductase [Niveibacterium umoris]MBB4012173.1 ferredoxin--NADP+ reductase [Niveibacterium umoris]
MSGSPETRYTETPVLSLHHWTPKLLSFRVERPRAFRFTPGQFARLGLDSADGAPVWRAYSMVSAVWDEHLEFLSILVPGGKFTSQLAQIQPDARIRIEKTATGFFTTDRFVDGTDLWLLATGTGLAPYLSILQDPAVWQRFERIVLVHCVQVWDELAYRSEIATLAQHPLWAEHAHKLRYQPVTTRDDHADALHARIPELLRTCALERALGVPLSPETSRLMICGNPTMVQDTHRQLMQMGYRLSRLSAPGQLVVENAW